MDFMLGAFLKEIRIVEITEKYEMGRRSLHRTKTAALIYSSQHLVLIKFADTILICALKLTKYEEIAFLVSRVTKQNKSHVLTDF